MRRSIGTDERGSATVLGAFVIAALVATTIGVLHIGGAVSARHRAQSAADLGALAAAQQIVAGAGADACATARRFVTDNGGRLTDCRPDGENVTVAVAVSVPLGSFGVRDARARARAGPMAAP
ncbi:Rv3654c family TadE-like protein [Williamsia sterculiae]|uniref:Helicase/secretion neighborhood TadE-like protein n=1 Tax=Williamsia sterculiae TaxID=1344003 RepID=A0A1N7F3P6_9NOCA|nr:Rv3654c family TadE-like protein [Williamsia sterculiae]SIR94835.1 helicase/secretion neighborhood TadE-like protein [Williamsia sterculiae]